MPYASRLCWWLLALSLSFNSSQPISAYAVAVQNSADETALRALAENYFKTWAAKDLDGLARLWSQQSPDLETRKKAWQELFASSAKIEVNQLLLQRVKIEGDKASVRVTVEATVIEAKTGQPRSGFGKMRRTLQSAKEEGRWKVWREISTFDEVAATLAAAKSDQERAALLAEEKELVTPELVRALSNRGERFYNQGGYSQALSIYQLAQSLAEQLGDQRGMARLLNDIGSVHWSQGNYAQALELTQKSLTMYEAQSDKAGIASVLNSIGNIHRHQGNHAQALDYYQKSLAVIEAMGDKEGMASALANIGVIYSVQGNLSQALNYYQKSLAMDEASGDKLGVAITLGNIGVIHRKQGNYPQALDYYQKSQAMSEAIDDKVGIAQMLNNIGTVHRLQGNYAPALECYQKSLATREAMGDKLGVADTLAAIGTVHRFQGDYAPALECYQKSLAMREAMEDKEGVARELVNIGVVHKKQGRYSQALDFADRASVLARETGSPEVLFASRINAGLAHGALNQSAQARQAFEEAIAMIETMRGQVAGGEQAQQRFFEDKISPYYAMVDLLAAQNNPTEALSFAERARARALLDLLYSGRVNINKAMTSEEQQQERKLRAEINSLNTKVIRASQQAKPDQAELNELGSLREKARLNYEAFQTALYAAHPELKVQRGEAPVIKAEEMAALLPDANSALLEYVVLDEATYLFVTTQASGKPTAEVQVYTLPIKLAELMKQTESFRAQLAARDLGFRASAMKLYELLLKPAQAQLKGKTNLVIVPDDVLWDLPFQALLVNSNRFLIEEAVLSYAPSLTVLREMAKRRKQPPANTSSTTLLALGNPAIGQGSRATLALRDEKLTPLPEAEQEARALGQLYGAPRSKVYIGAQAREDRVKAEAGQASILHFATHGILNNAAPMYSHLVLAQGDTNEDGLLEAWELMQMDLKAELAVLSACETARGRYGAGEGMIGLTWALFVAGVPTTVVSQWKVESASTRDLMLSFHRQLRASTTTTKAPITKAAALQQAALSLLKRPETSHPFYWAGFVIVGDGR